MQNSSNASSSVPVLPLTSNLDPSSNVTRWLCVFLVGSILTVFINIWEAYSSYVQHGSRMTFGYLPMATLVPFVFIVLFLNSFLRLLSSKLVLRPPELIVIFIMGLTAAIFPALGLVGFLLSVLATPYYFATTENAWAEYLHAYIPKWAVPSSNIEQMKWFFDGMPEGEKIPWDVWFIPLAWWLCFIIALFIVSTCIMVIFRRQWVERERLIFPLAEVPLEMVQDSDGSSFLPNFARSRVFWLGAAIPLFIICWNIITYFQPDLPAIPIGRRFSWIRIARGFPVIFTKINFFVIGFAFLTNLDVLLSIWLFHLLTVIQIGIENRIGFTIGAADLWCAFDAATGWQSFGGFLFFVLWGIWIARRHLKDVFKKAFSASYPLDDSDEMLSYRAAVFGLIGGLFFIIFWFRKMGMEYHVIGLYLFGAFVIYFGVTKLVAQCGLVYVRATMTAQSFTLFSLGPSTMSPSSMTALLFSYAYCCDAKSSIFATVAHAAKLGSVIRINKKHLLLAMGVATVIGLIVSTWYTLYLGYNIGAYNFGAWEYQSGNIRIVNTIVNKMKNPLPTDWRRLSFLGIGFSLMGVLTFLKYRFSWWPLHPIGFALGGNWPTRASAFSIFIAWACKFVILKLGGITLYRKSRPFFLGMLVGYAMGVGLSFVVDMIWFPGEGHVVHIW